MTDTRQIRTGPSVPRDDASHYSGLVFLILVTLFMVLGGLLGRAWMEHKPEPVAEPADEYTEIVKVPLAMYVASEDYPDGAIVLLPDGRAFTCWNEGMLRLSRELGPDWERHQVWQQLSTHFESPKLEMEGEGEF